MRDLSVLVAEVPWPAARSARDVCSMGCRFLVPRCRSQKVFPSFLVPCLTQNLHPSSPSSASSTRPSSSPRLIATASPSLTRESFLPRKPSPLPPPIQYSPISFPIITPSADSSNTLESHHPHGGNVASTVGWRRCSLQTWSETRLDLKVVDANRLLPLCIRMDFSLCMSKNLSTDQPVSFLSAAFRHGRF
jgi:hypothetical protein